MWQLKQARVLENKQTYIYIYIYIYMQGVIHYWGCGSMSCVLAGLTDDIIHT